MTSLDDRVPRKPARTSRVPRKLWVLLGVVVLAVVLLAQNSVVLVDSYAVVDQRTISVRAAVAPCSWTRVTGVVETAREVRVRVETVPCPIPGPSTGSLVDRDLSVSLAADLGSRVVEDADGHPVPMG